MTFHWNPKKLIAIAVLLLVCCDVSLLFATQTDSDNNAALQQQLQQVQQLQQQALTQQGAAQPSSQQTAPTLPPALSQPTVAPTDTTAADATLNGAAAPAALAQLPPPQGIAAPPPTPINQNANATTASAVPAGAVSVQDVSNSAFTTMTQGMLPMSSDQIQRLRQLFDQSQFAASALPNTPARGVISSQFVNLAPGSTPPVIRLQQGMVSVLTFLDSTGAPWPIQAYDVGNPSAFNIQWNKSDNMLMFQPLTPYPYANMAIMLQGMSTPLILTLTAGQKAFDARLDMHVQGLGPNAQAAPTGSGLPNGPSPDLLGVLDGIPPDGSTILHVAGGAAQAWLANGKLFVRTRYTIISPGWIATMSSADGMKAYEMSQTPMLLVMRDGKIIQLKVEGL